MTSGPDGDCAVMMGVSAKHDGGDYTAARAVLVVGSNERARARGAAAVVSSGCRVAATVDLANAVARLDAQAVTGGVIVELDEVGADAIVTDDLERLLARLDADARADRYASVVSTPRSMIDLVAGLAGHGSIHQLADATDMDRTAAVVVAVTAQSMSLRDIGADADTQRLRQLTDEVGRIASALARLSSTAYPPAAGLIPAAVDVPPTLVDAEEIRGMIRARRMRAHYFDAALFADPAWDMLLDLMASHVEQQRVAVSSLCIAAAVPATTALRWIKTLTDLGLFVRRADPTDGRRVFIELGEDAACGLRGYLGAIKRLANAPGMGMAQMAV